MHSLFTSSPCPSPTDIGDYVMMESCIDNGHVFDKSCLESYPVRPRPDHSQWRRKQKKEFPPPLTVLAMTENHRPHMPFAMRRFTTDDGRLVIVEEKVKHHDYFRVTRSEGRLVLDLIEIDERETNDVKERETNDVDDRGIDDVEERELVSGDECCNVVVRNTKKADDVEERENNDVEESESIIDDDGRNVEARNDYKSNDVEERECDELEERENVDGNECCNVAIRSVGKCYDYMRVRSSPCLFTMTMPTVRPVHI